MLGGCRSQSLNRPVGAVPQRFRKVPHFYGVRTRQVPYGRRGLEHRMKGPARALPTTTLTLTMLAQAYPSVIKHQAKDRREGVAAVRMKS